MDTSSNFISSCSYLDVKDLINCRNSFLRNSTTKVDPEVISPAEKNLFYLDHVCSSSKSFTNRFNFSSRWNLNVTQIQQIADAIDKEASRNQSVSEVRSFLRNASQPCMEMIRHCTWKDKIINCTKIFRPIETDFGKCCTFNMVPQTLLHIFRFEFYKRSTLSIVNVALFHTYFLYFAETMTGMTQRNWSFGRKRIWKSQRQVTTTKTKEGQFSL